MTVSDEDRFRNSARNILGWERSGDDLLKAAALIWDARFERRLTARL